ncbi:MAG TPA: M23 family metallopeptidase [Candidatus Binatia bacterium]|nr:M23 family metallopeptidase [Candidatus Binatia bacterium]
MRGRGWAVAVMVASALAACGGPAGVRHRVERGESLYRIGKAYGVSPETLARVNGIKDAGRIEVGQTIVIPNARRQLPVGVITPERAREDRPAPPELPRGPSPFVWPVEAGVLSSSFGPRGDSHHDGIDISTPEGTPVRAARAGRVLYSDRLRGYGNLIIIAHDEGYATVYAHNRENRRRAGDEVRQGDVIGVVGSTGKTSGPNLHFEIRKDNVARNPLFYLPPLPAGRAASGHVDVVQGAHD